MDCLAKIFSGLNWILLIEWLFSGQGFFQEYRYLFLDFLDFSYLKCLFQGVSFSRFILKIFMFSHFLIIMIVEGLLQGGLRPPWPPAAAQGLSRSRGRGVHDKTEATWFIKCCILKKFWSQSSLMKGFSCLWAIITCIFKLLFLENFLSQNSHSKCFFFLWTEATWFKKLLFLENNGYKVHIWKAFPAYEPY